jgi:hypothetical protein
MIHRPKRGALITNRKSIARAWVGPAVVVGMPSESKFLVSDFTGVLLPVLLHRREVKLYNARLMDPKTSALEAASDVTEVLNALRSLQVQGEPLIANKD